MDEGWSDIRSGIEIEAGENEVTVQVASLAFGNPWNSVQGAAGGGRSDPDMFAELRRVKVERVEATAGEVTERSDVYRESPNDRESGGEEGGKGQREERAREGFRVELIDIIPTRDCSLTFELTVVKSMDVHEQVKIKREAREFLQQN